MPLLWTMPEYAETDGRERCLTVISSCATTARTYMLIERQGRLPSTLGNLQGSLQGRHGCLGSISFHKRLRPTWLLLLWYLAAGRVVPGDNLQGHNIKHPISALRPRPVGQAAVGTGDRVLDYVVPQRFNILRACLLSHPISKPAARPKDALLTGGEACELFHIREHGRHFHPA